MILLEQRDDFQSIDQARSYMRNCHGLVLDHHCVFGDHWDIKAVFPFIEDDVRLVGEDNNKFWGYQDGLFVAVLEARVRLRPGDPQWTYHGYLYGPGEATAAIIPRTRAIRIS
jgi:hypothetical protein